MGTGTLNKRTALRVLNNNGYAVASSKPIYKHIYMYMYMYMMCDLKDIYTVWLLATHMGSKKQLHFNSVGGGWKIANYVHHK